MTNSIHLEENRDFFFTEKHEDVIILRFRGHLFQDITDLGKRDTLFAYLDRVSESNDIKTIVIDASLVKSSSEEFCKFLLKQSREPLKLTIHRYCNVTSQLVLKIMDSNQIVIHTCQGKMSSFFLSLALACDYRIAAENTNFSNTDLEVDVLPKGGAPFFISRMLGAGKAYEILLLHKAFSAYQALSYGIVDRIVPAEKLEETALEVAHRFGCHHHRFVSGVKRLVNYSIRDLEEYMKFEDREIERVLSSSEFVRRMKDKGVVV